LVCHSCSHFRAHPAFERRTLSVASDQSVPLHLQSLYLYALGKYFKRCVCRNSREICIQWMVHPRVHHPSSWTFFPFQFQSSQLSGHVTFIFRVPNGIFLFLHVRVLCSHACALAPFGKCYTLPHWWPKLGQSKSFVPVAPVVGHALVGAHDDIHTLSFSRRYIFDLFQDAHPYCFNVP
jgi:hypothetical protein